MAPIATYVFFDLGTTGLLETNPKITEVHMIAVMCKNLRRYFRERGEENFANRPSQRILHCVVDDTMWSSRNESSDAEESSLSDEIAEFLNALPKPLCLIAHNGPKFDFPLLKRELATAEEFSTKGIYCADSMAAFYDILEPESEKTSYAERRLGAFPWPWHVERKSYRLENVCKTVLQCQPVLYNAKDRNRVLKRIAVGFSYEFMLWVAENKCPFTIAK